MTKNIAVIRGDGIGPEIVNEALRVLDKIAELYGHTFHYTDVDMGGCAIDKWGDPLPQEMLDKCVASDSVLLVRRQHVANFILVFIKTVVNVQDLPARITENGVAALFN